MKLQNAAHEVICWVAVLTASTSISLGGIWGFILQCLLGVFSIWLDWVVSPTTSNNLKRLGAHGYPAHALVALMLFNQVSTNALVALIAYHFGCFEAPMRADWKTVLAVLCNLTVAEAAFTLGHYLLHTTRVLAPFHVLHHCCKPCSWSTNLLFHPVDMAVEFSGPIASLVVSHLLVWRDPIILIISLMVLHAWYAFDHSENLKL